MEYNKEMFSEECEVQFWNKQDPCIMQGKDGMFWQLGSPDQSLLSNKVTTETQANKQSDVVPKQQETN